MKKLFSLTILAAAFMVAFTSCKKEEETTTTMSGPTDDIVDIALADDQFDSLVVALDRAGLVSTFQGDDSGPFTLFAPTNTAFVNLLSALKLPDIESIGLDLLTAVLKYHVISGKVMSTDLTDGMVAKTLDGYTVKFDLSGATPILYANKSYEANITGPNNEATNGVIHIIDAVIVPTQGSPAPTNDITEVAVAAGFDSLAVALTEAGLLSTFQGDDSGPYTVFAPTNGAFVTLLSNLSLASIKDIPAGTLDDVLKYHVFDGIISSDQLSDGQMIKTLEGYTFTIDLTSGAQIDADNTTGITINPADQWATNGIIHVIDAVMVPTVSPK